jgi:hypothetical protein
MTRRQLRAAEGLTVGLWHILRTRLRSLLFPDCRKSELTEELQLHTELAVLPIVNPPNMPLQPTNGASRSAVTRRIASAARGLAAGARGESGAERPDVNRTQPT